VLRYLQEFARRFDLYGMVRLRTEVASVRREASASWRVTSHSTSELAGGGGPVEEVFDAVVVCNGHFVTPRVANIAGNQATIDPKSLFVVFYT
jgi:cation diffusion facilitator CzcD-associated flavoprotein CzcO